MDWITKAHYPMYQVSHQLINWCNCLWVFYSTYLQFLKFSFRQLKKTKNVMKKLDQIFKSRSYIDEKTHLKRQVEQDGRINLLPILPYPSFRRVYFFIKNCTSYLRAEHFFIMLKNELACMQKNSFAISCLSMLI